jgi:2-deoxy-D-gluconate 3-dehydrogenase
MLMLTRSLPIEWAPFRITVDAVLPGGIGTPGTAAISEGMLAAGMTQEQLTAAFTARIPLKRMGEPDDIAKVVLFLASDAAVAAPITTPLETYRSKTRRLQVPRSLLALT